MPAFKSLRRQWHSAYLHEYSEAAELGCKFCAMIVNIVEELSERVTGEEYFARSTNETRHSDQKYYSLVLTVSGKRSSKIPINETHPDNKLINNWVGIIVYPQGIVTELS